MDGIRWQRAGYLALSDTTWGGSNELETYDGKYWMSFLGGALQGYETDPEHPPPWLTQPRNPRSLKACPIIRANDIAAICSRPSACDRSITFFPWALPWASMREAVGLRSAALRSTRIRHPQTVRIRRGRAGVEGGSVTAFEFFSSGEGGAEC